jgi:predicted lipoprotein with Yx(FWY)xxD motif
MYVYTMDVRDMKTHDIGKNACKPVCAALFPPMPTNVRREHP